MEAVLNNVTECNEEETIEAVITVEKICRICGKVEHYELSGDHAAYAAEVLQRMDPVCERCFQERQRRDLMPEQIRTQTLAAGVPEEFFTWDSTLGNNDLLRFCFEAIGRWAFIADEVDRGKTRSVCRAVREYCRQHPGKRAGYWNLNELADNYVAALSRQYDQGNKLRRELEQLDFLVLDDLGKKGVYTQAVSSLLYDLANNYYTRGADLWIVANRRFSDCRYYFGDQDAFDAIYSRFGRIKAAGRYAGWNFGEAER